jgi:hypothetical protein
MRKKYIPKGRKVLQEAKMISSTTPQLDQPAYMARSDSSSDTEIDQDINSSATLFRPRLKWVPE